MSVTQNDDIGLSNESLLDLPPVQVSTGESAPSVPPAPEVATQQGTERNPELLPVQPTIQGQPGQLPQSGATPVATPQAQPVNQTPQTVSGTAVPTPQIADDVDLIEKEWVEKAKSIVAKTKADPRAQNQEINQVKAEYIKKRFNKELRTK